MTLDAALPAGDGIQDFRNPMTDVIPYNITDKKTGQQNTNDWIYQIQPVGTGRIKILRQEMLDIFNQELQQASGQSGQDTHHKTEYQDKMLILYLLFTPQVKALQQS